MSEPTTGEIVRALRCVAEAIECKDCRYKYPVGNFILCDHEQMNGNAADRLESQEQTIAALTARAEQADNANDWRYALMKLINENPEIKCASICDGDCMDCATSASGTARGFRLKKNLSGLPQDGEGK